MEVMSSILAIGVVNSGMFDTIEFSTDVHALQFVGDNNVGKTSLIEMMQFLYFPNLKDMRFAKPDDESMRFYFRPEGSYMLFCVRTVQNTERTIGVYGTGTAASRTYFVFDGRFRIDDFLDAQSKVLPLTPVQRALGNRQFYRFDTYDAYDRALIGEHATPQANVALFTYTAKEFGMLRTLLRNLLRLNQITSHDVRKFLHDYAENQGYTTTIDIAHTYAEKTEQMDSIRRQLEDIATLAPRIQDWEDAQKTVVAAELTLQTTQARAWHIHQLALTHVGTELHHITASQSATSTHIADLEAAQKIALTRQGELRAEIKELQQHHTRLQELTASCAHLDPDQLQRDADALSSAIDRITKRLQKPSDVASLRRKQAELEQQRDRLSASLHAPNIEQTIRQSDYTADERALALYLINQELREEQSREFIHDHALLRATIQGWLKSCDADGTFVGWGLRIPATRWRRTIPPVDVHAAIAEIDDQLANITAELRSAQDQAGVHKELQQHQEKRKFLNNHLQRYRDYQNYINQYRSLDTVADTIAEKHQELQVLDQQTGTTTSQLTAFRSELQEQRVQQQTHQQRQAELTTQLSTLPDAAHIPADPDLPLIPATNILDEAQRSKQKCHRDQQTLESKRLQQHDARQRLERVYDNTGDQRVFTEWVNHVKERVNSMAQLNQQLQDSINNLATYISGELSALVKSYEVVHAHVNNLQQHISNVQISNISRISLRMEPSSLMTHIQGWQEQQTLFSVSDTTMTPQERATRIQNELRLMLHGNQRTIDLADLYTLKFHIDYVDGSQHTATQIHHFESNGTNIAVKITIYLGLIRLLKSKKVRTTMRIPFFLDEVGSLSANNLTSLIAYCERHRFLPIFASPNPSEHISHNLILRRNGSRSQLITTITVTPPAQEATP